MVPPDDPIRTEIFSAAHDSTLLTSKLPLSSFSTLSRPAASSKLAHRERELSQSFPWCRREARESLNVIEMVIDKRKSFENLSKSSMEEAKKENEIL